MPDAPSYFTLNNESENVYPSIILNWLNAVTTLRIHSKIVTLSS